MIETLHLFRPLNEKLLEVLRGLTRKEWDARTVAKEWTVKDVAAHLLDGNVRTISFGRDGMMIKPDQELRDYGDVVRYLNRLNADWVTAMKRVSPEILIGWLDATHEGFISCLEKLDPNAEARFSVAWAGEKVSTNWFHVAREFTEKWHHQQQIREAVDKQGILTKELYEPVLDTFMRALPFRYEKIKSANGTRILISVEAPVNKTWIIERRQEQWKLAEDSGGDGHVIMTIPAAVSWKLFTKAVRYEDVTSSIKIKGDERLALPALEMVTVMA